MKALDDRTMANLDVASKKLVDLFLMEATTKSGGRSHKSCSVTPSKETRRYLD